MAVPDVSNPVWRRLAGGGLNQLKTQHLGAQLLVSRIQRSADSEADKAREIHAFFAKWERGLGQELQQLSSM